MLLVKRLIGFLVTIIFSALIVVVTLQVVARVFSLSMPWTEELAKFLFIWAAFLGGYFTIYKGINITFDLVIDYLPKKLWNMVFTFINVVSVIFLGLVGYLGFTLSALNMTNLSPVMGIPYGYVYLAMPIGALVMILAQLESYVREMKKKDEVKC